MLVRALELVRRQLLVVPPPILATGMNVPVLPELRPQLVARIAVHVQDGVDGQVLHPFMLIMCDEIPQAPLQHLLHQLGLPAVVVGLGLKGAYGAFAQVPLIPAKAALPVRGDAAPESIRG